MQKYKIDAHGERVVQGMLARAGVLRGHEDDQARQGNPAASASLIDLAEQSLMRAGVNARRMSRDEIARHALALGSCDFPVLLENMLHKVVVGAYRLMPFTWSRLATNPAPHIVALYSRDDRQTRLSSTRL